ncbi:aminopeptidase N [Bartonella sp. DGB2]|uniref:aminopeptidase N n=1 Tax=Bartonella sp. DGB2 TaxID=3388426 RepID=UPI00398FF52F
MQPNTLPYRLENYQPTPYALPKTELCFRLSPNETIVDAKLTFSPRHSTKPHTPLILDGDDLNLLAITLNGMPLDKSAYHANDKKLEIFMPPSGDFTLELTTTINPEKNLELMGLYLTNGIYCTQCEAEGFRRITYFYDRPDVLSTYYVRLEADQKTAPILLSNGNLIEKGVLKDGRHFTIWHDPFPKPSYLFALVGGVLDQLEDSFTTQSGREVKLNIYVEQGNRHRSLFAMDALKRAMAWDETRFGREYDLDIFNIVAVSAFNMGAMENKGLNIYNDQYILADPQTATDNDYMLIEAVIAHEYFHNWTGNRITCRDWFQLCLKEGLTVFRDHSFSSDVRGAGVTRIKEINDLKLHQFSEDAGPLAHPVRPREYNEINNFYTMTVYEKGAEVVRMLHTILGETLFRKGMDLYFNRYDGQAATVEDFISCFAEVSGRDFSQFFLWYEQAGTPQVKVESQYEGGALTLTLTQTIPPTPQQEEKQPMLIPIAFGLLGRNGQDMTYTSDLNAQNGLLLLSKKQQTFRFSGLKEAPILSLLRGFSAPIILKSEQSDDERVFLARHDKDQVNRWLALQELYTKAMSAMVKGEEAHLPASLSALTATLIQDEGLDFAFRALCLRFPTPRDLAQTISKNIDPDHIQSVYQQARTDFAKAHHSVIAMLYEALPLQKPYQLDNDQVGKRTLKNALLSYLALSENDPTRAYTHFETADNMTDRLSSLSVLCYEFFNSSEAKAARDAYEARYNKTPLALDKFFAVQARTVSEDSLERVQELMQHQAFSLDNPNRVRALIGSFISGNEPGFHRVDGASYEFLVEIVLKLDKINPQVAASLLTKMATWKRLEPNRSAKAKAALEKVKNSASLSADVTDIVNRSLA